MDNPIHQISSPITYFSAIKIAFRVYGIYLLLTGLTSVILWLPNLPIRSDVDTIFLIAKSADMVEGLAKALVGAGLLIGAPGLAHRIAAPGQEIALREDQLATAVENLLRFVLILIMIHQLSAVIVSLLLLGFLQLAQSFDAGVTLQLIVPLLLLLICSLIYKTAPRLAKRITQ